MVFKGDGGLEATGRRLTLLWNILVLCIYMYNMYSFMRPRNLGSDIL